MLLLDVSKRGFGSMDSEKRRAIASLGGSSSGGNFARNPQRASEAGRKGGLNRHRKKNLKKTEEQQNVQNPSI